MPRLPKAQPVLHVALGFVVFIITLVVLLGAFGFFSQPESIKQETVKRGTIGYEEFLIPPDYNTTDYTPDPSLDQYKESVVQLPTPRTYYLYQSSGFKAGRRATFILLLHGAGRDGRSMIDKWKSVIDGNNVVIAAPNSFQAAWSTTFDRIGLFNDILKKTEDDLNITFDKRFIFGHSSGAVHAIDIANENPDAWCAVVANSGFPDPERIDHSFSNAPPVQILLGMKDHIFSLNNAHRVADRLSRHGHNVKVVKIPLHTHWYYSAAEQINEKAYDFFNDQDC